MTDTIIAKSGPVPITSNDSSKPDNRSTAIVKTTPATALPDIRPEHMIYPNGDVILAFPKHPPSGRPQRRSTQPSVFIRASSAALHVAYVLRCMVRDGKLRHADDYASHGYITIDLPHDDWQAFAFLLLVIRGATEEELDGIFFDILTLVQLAILIDKYDLTDIIEPYGDYFIGRARQSDHSVMRRLGVYVWVARVFEASSSHWELTAMAQNTCTGFRKYKTPDDDSLEEETTVTPLPNWVMDGILEKRMATFNIIQASLVYSQTDCYIRAENSHAVGDIADFFEVPSQITAIDQLSDDLGVPLSGKITDRKMKGISVNTIISRLNELRDKPLEHSCKITGEAECFHKSLQAVVALAAKGIKAGTPNDQKVEGKFVFDPVGHILERLSSSDAWEEQGSSLGFGFGLLNAVKAETKSEKPEDVVASKCLKRKRI
ncbi:hypothetical protein F5X68DRAFT_244849 [Plectosphaerella plurivora]|uniref:Uncharacterized protein n=1 Tax=Plectosphaerella plurivora TaxID=936078 RepID=A0A9P8V6L6_9PEZI|nr:hypothetical protein F5X68DRAFT_244849 [Plectosphaerella plurivora]